MANRDRLWNAGAGASIVCSAIAFSLAAASASFAAISEPDHLFYGVVTYADGVPNADPLTSATVFLRSDGDCSASHPTDELASSGPGALPDDPQFFVLAVRVESLIAGDTGPTPGIARSGDMGTVCVTFTDPSTSDVHTVPAGNVTIGGRGLAVRLDLQVASDGSVAADSDGDGVPDSIDNCGGVANGSQTDANGNGIGDACDCLTTPTAPICLNASPIFSRIEEVDNAADSNGLGSVSYPFEIGSTEVTNAEYHEFLSAVAADDLHSLYHESMASDARGGITRTGSAGTYSYVLKPNMADKPVNFVSWLDAARFANWRENGKPGGAQDATTTETGAFDLTVANPGETAVLNPNAIWSLPNEDEWYKAAYYDPFAAAYWSFPTGSDADPLPATADSLGNNVAPGPNVANYDSTAAWNGVADNVVSVASSESPSPYGSHDQGGNVAEWMASPVEGPFDWRIIRGGSYRSQAFQLRSDAATPGDSANRPSAWRDPGYQGADVGFRVVRVLAGDSDGDGLFDDEDNCILAANGPDAMDRGGNVQLDTDQDGYGNLCDSDLNQSGLTDFLDLGLFKSRFFSADPDADLNGDGVADFLDLGVLKSLFFQSPGPSGLECAGTVPCS